MIYSYSAISTYLNCPAQFASKYVYKNAVKSSSDALEWGRAVHEGIEDYMGKSIPMPSNVAHYKPWVDAVMAKAEGSPITVEQKLCVDKRVQPQEFFGDRGWIRGATDVLIQKPDVTAIVDWKTGKVRPDKLQADIYFMMSQAIAPAPRTTMTFIYLKYGQTRTYKYELSDLPGIIDHLSMLTGRIDNAIATDTFGEQPTGLCGYCPNTRCKHNRTL